MLTNATVNANEPTAKPTSRVESPMLRRKAQAEDGLAPARVGDCACGGSCPRCSGATASLMPKLEVSQPGDALEQEADRVAEAVMSGESSAGTGKISTPE